MGENVESWKLVSCIFYKAFGFVWLPRKCKRFSCLGEIQPVRLKPILGNVFLVTSSFRGHFEMTKELISINLKNIQFNNNSMLEWFLIERVSLKFVINQIRSLWYKNWINLFNLFVQIKKMKKKFYCFL